MVTYLKVPLKWNHRVNEQNVQGTRCRGLVPYGTSENNYANSTNSCKELDALTGKRIKVVE